MNCLDLASAHMKVNPTIIINCWKHSGLNSAQTALLSTRSAEPDVMQYVDEEYRWLVDLILTHTPVEDHLDYSAFLEVDNSFVHQLH